MVGYSEQSVIYRRGSPWNYSTMKRFTINLLTSIKSDKVNPNDVSKIFEKYEKHQMVPDSSSNLLIKYER